MPSLGSKLMSIKFDLNEILEEIEKEKKKDQGKSKSQKLSQQEISKMFNQVNEERKA